MPKYTDPSCVIVLVTFNTFDWTISCLPQLRQHIPSVDVLVVDNNPCRGTERSKSFHGKTVYGTSLEWNEYREKERKWIHSVKDKFNLKIIQTPWFMDHGRAVDFAVQGISHYDAFIHIEPDCDIYGTIWLERLKQRIIEGYWMSSGHIYPSKELHPTPSIWRLDVWNYLGLSFVAFPRKVFTGQERLFYQTIDTRRLLRTHQHHWDTGLYAAYRCARRKRAAYVDVPDFRHFYRGSDRRNITSR